MGRKPIKVEMNHNLKIQHYSNPNTREQYYRSADDFARYLKDHGMKYATPEEAKGQIQNYISHLRDEGKSASTQKARLAGVCSALGEQMKNYKYDSVGIPTRGRDTVPRRNETNERIVEFAKAVGIRENEYAKLTGKEIVEKDGRTYVIVEKGKGGKYQEQLIHEKDVDFVKSYFSGKGENERIFTHQEMVASEHANLHACRREHAQELYQHYKSMGPDERKEIIALLRERFDANPKKCGKFDEAALNKPIHLRGIYRQEYLSRGMEPTLDRFAVRAVSVLHLAHYRDDVVCHNYFI